MTQAYYYKFESFALVDGPGVRSVFFLSGCPFRCLYCHNPESWTKNSNTQTISSIDALNKLERYASYWQNNGGITISGGEPLLQIDFLIELFTLAKKKGYSTCIDTSGAPFDLHDESFMNKFNQLLQVCDLMLLDIKAIDNNLHQKITGKSNTNVLEMFKYLSDKNYPIWIRYVLVPNLTDDINTLKLTKDFVNTLNNVKRFEVLPYHSLAMSKYQDLNIEYPLKEIYSPTKSSIDLANSILETSKYTEYLNK